MCLAVQCFGHQNALSVMPFGVVLVLVVDCLLLGLGFCTTLDQTLDP